MTPSSRQQILSHYPAAQGETSAAQSYRRWLQHLLNARWRDEETGGIVMPYTCVAALDGVNPRSHGFNASRRLTKISQELMPLRIGAYDRWGGKARVIHPETPAEIAAIWQEELAKVQPNRHLLREDFVTGEPLSRRGRAAELKTHLAQLRDEVRAPQEHPGLALLAFLNGQPARSIQSLVSKNWRAACEALYRLPEGLGKQLACGILLHVAEQQQLVYTTVLRSHRLFAKGPNLTQLPRHLRGELLRGTWQHDLTSAQLAIVASVWVIPELLQFLESDRVIWVELSEYVGLGCEYKPVVKSASYRLLFGGSRQYAKRDLARGEGLIPGMGGEKAERLLRHPLMIALLEARELALNRIRREGGVEDAFGVWHSCVTNDASERRSYLALQAQSYEMYLMLSLLPVLQAEHKTRVVVWLHDGIYTQGPEPERVRNRMQGAITQAASELQIQTRLESKYVQ